MKSAMIRIATGVVVGVALLAGGTQAYLSMSPGVVWTHPSNIAGPGTDSVPDPTLLPDADSVSNLTHTDGELNDSLPNDGDCYVQPGTGATVCRVTDPTFPASNLSATTDYANGGPYVSLEWDCGDDVPADAGDECYTIVAYLYLDVQWWFVDFNRTDLTFRNGRQFSVCCDLETGYAWSLDETTPRIIYYTDFGTLNAYDTDAMASANGDYANLPHNPSNANIDGGGWVQTSRDDECISWQDSGAGQGEDYVVLELATGTELLDGELGASNSFDEHYLTPDCGHVIGVQDGAGDVDSGHRVIRVSDGADIGLAQVGATTPGLVHAVVADSVVIGFDTGGDAGQGPRHFVFAIDSLSTGVSPDTGSVDGGGRWMAQLSTSPAANHDGAQWRLANNGQTKLGFNSWYAVSGDQGGTISDIGWCGNALCLHRPSDNKVVHLAFTDQQQGGTYNESTFFNLQPKGAFGIFTSGMNDDDGNRSDLFLAVIPRSAN